MKKTVFIILLSLLLYKPGYSQNNLITRIEIPQIKHISLLRSFISKGSDHLVIKADILQESANTPLLFFNNQQILILKKDTKKPLTFFADLSFSDVLETSVNSLKTGLINTYDDQITELFKDAPSLVKVKCIIPF